MRIEESHTFTAEEAQKRLKLLVESWEKKVGLNVKWEGPMVKVNGKAMGITIQADVRVEPTRIIAEGADPGMLFRSAAVSYLKRKFGEYFDPKVTLDDLAKRSA